MINQNSFRVRKEGILPKINTKLKVYVNRKKIERLLLGSQSTRFSLTMVRCLNSFFSFNPCLALDDNRTFHWSFSCPLRLLQNFFYCSCLPENFEWHLSNHCLLCGDGFWTSRWLLTEISIFTLMCVIVIPADRCLNANSHPSCFRVCGAWLRQLDRQQGMSLRIRGWTIDSFSVLTQHSSCDEFT
jgi:hypothetical protein